MAMQYDDVLGEDSLNEVVLPPELRELSEDTNDVDEWRQSIVQGMIQEAIDWRAEELDTVQAEATDYYHGRAFGNEEKGRSRVVLTDVRDVVLGIIPSLMRMFWGAEKPVEYKPEGQEDVKSAEQATDYVRHVIAEDNPGFLIFHDVFMDALVRKQGIAKYWWEDEEVVEEIPMTGLTEAELLVLDIDEEVEYVVEKIDGDEPDEPDEPEGEEAEESSEKIYDITVVRRSNEGRVCVASVPNEEFIFSPGAKGLDDAALVGHIRMVPADELIEMGIDSDLVNEAKAHSGLLEGELIEARRFDTRSGHAVDERDPKTELVMYCEAYVMLTPEAGDEDEDTVSPAELRRVCTVGDSFEIVSDDPAPRRPFAIFCPAPEPHTFVGSSQADLTMDIQKIKSAILRGQLDSLNQTLHPREVVQLGKVSMQDVLNREIGGVIRATGDVNSVLREIVTTFVGKEAFPMMDYMDNVREERTGHTKASEGLDPDALQSSTKTAVEATLGKAQERTEMIARMFAETGMKDLFKGLLALICENQDKGRMIRLRGEFVFMDPRSWNATMDVQVNVALGMGLTDSKLKSLALIYQEQKEHLEKGSPLVSYAGLRRTLARFVELSGWKNVDDFFEPFGEKEQEQLDQQMAQAQESPQDPAMALVQVEAQKNQMEAKHHMAELELKRDEARMKDDRERDKMARDAALREREIELKHQVEINDAALRAAVARDRAAMDADVKRETAAQPGGSQ